MNDVLPNWFYTAQQTRELDAGIIAEGISGFDLMQRAALALWQNLLQRWPEAGQISVLCGGGNNAGDGYLLARLAHQAGYQVQVHWLVDPVRLKADAALAWQTALTAGVEIQPWTETIRLQGVVVDALLGTGLQGEVRAPFTEAIKAINASGLAVLAVDLPSGLHADRGVPLGMAVKATLTLSFIGLKPGLCMADGPDYCGELRFAPLADLPRVRPQPAAERLSMALWQKCLGRRPRAAHKGLFGHLVLLGGDQGMGGAIILAAEAALRSGAGKVSVVTRDCHVMPLLARCPELMVKGVEQPADAAGLIAAADVLVIGPGLGRADWGLELLEMGLARNVPKVLDADALNTLAEMGDAGRALGNTAIITPHPAEAARLLRISTTEVQADRLKALQRLVERWGCAVVLKGVGSLIAGPDEQARPPALCTYGNPAMATAGMGDVLSGLAGALLAQGLTAPDAARYAVLLHALAGDQAAAGDQRGLLASDLFLSLRQLLNQRDSE